MDHESDSNGDAVIDLPTTNLAAWECGPLGQTNSEENRVVNVKIPVFTRKKCISPE